MDDEMQLIDEGVADAIVNYVALGLPPGSFTEALLRGDADDAYSRAHPTLTQDSDIVAEMIHLVDHNVPVFARGENMQEWMKHQGLAGADDAIRTTIHIAVEQHYVLNRVKQRFPHLI